MPEEISRNVCTLIFLLILAPFFSAAAAAAAVVVFFFFFFFSSAAASSSSSSYSSIRTRFQKLVVCRLKIRTSIVAASRGARNMCIRVNSTRVFGKIARIYYRQRTPVQ